MAVYDGFFDAVIDEDSGEYDRAYSSGDFTTYFEKIVGSGVCVHNDPDSFRVRMAGGAAVVSPGYLFIQGYWLRNDADYTIPLSGDSTLAIAAHLNLGKRMIELEAVSVAQFYQDTLVLALVNPAANTAEDTRYNTDICGVIDSAGALSTKVEWAINYIDNEIESKLAAAEADIAEQSARLDAKIAEVQAQVDKIAPPPVGTIQFSASQNVGEEWLRCDGRFVNERDYPELVAALGKLTPSGDKFEVLSDGEVGPQISNGVSFGGRLWVYSYATKKLYGVDLEGKEAVKEIPVSSEDPYFPYVHPPTAQQPIALSLVTSPVDGKTRLFLAQILADGVSFSTEIESRDTLWIYTSEFTGNETSITVSPAFTTCKGSSYLSPQSKQCVPFVISSLENGAEVYFCVVGGLYAANTSSHRYGIYAKWSEMGGTAELGAMKALQLDSAPSPYFSLSQRIAYDFKNKNEAVFVMSYRTGASSSSYSYSTSIVSRENGIFDRGSYTKVPTSSQTLSVPNGLNVAGYSKLLFGMSTTAIMSISMTEIDEPKIVETGLPLPSAARIFVDGGAYLWGKDMFLIFVGTGIIFSRTLEEGSFGYLDTTSVLGTITQFGWLGYSQDEETLYLLGQDTSNRVKAAKIVLNTLYDYANDGAWLPVIASDGVPAYIKAYDPDAAEVDKVPMTVTIDQPSGFFGDRAEILFNGEALIPGTYTRQVVENGTFTVGCRMTKSPGNNSTTVSLNGNKILEIYSGEAYIGLTKTASFKVSDYISAGITLKGG